MPFTCLMLFLIFTTYFGIRGGGTPGKRFCIAVACQVALVCAVLAYAPNIFRNQEWGMHHIHAYENSIVNVMNHAPYSNIQFSIYGFYAVVYYPFVKLLGDDTFAIALTISFFVFVTYVMFFYAAKRMVKNRLLFGILVLAIGGTAVTFFSRGQYYQVQPQRFLFPALTMAFLIWQAGGNRNPNQKRIAAAEWILGSAGVLFNLESGLFSLVTISAFHVFERRNRREQLWEAGKRLVYGAGCFLLAYGMVNLYNWMVGGAGIGLKRFIFPFLSAEYDVSTLRTPLPDVFAGFFVHIVVFSYTAIRAMAYLWNTKNADEEKRRQRQIQLTVAISGLCALTYYMNRTAAQCIMISHIPFVLLLGHDAETFWNARKEDLAGIVRQPERLFRLSSSFIAYLLVAWFAIEGVLSVGWSFHNRATTVWNTDSLHESLEIFQQEIPRDTLAFGTGMPELYYYLGWDPQIAIGDWSDMNHYGVEEVDRKVSEAESFVMMDGIGYPVPEDFFVVKQVATENFSCTYYMRK